MVYLKTGKWKVKTYEDLWPEKIGYFRVGYYKLDLRDSVLTEYPEDESFNLKDLGILQFLYELNIDFRRDGIVTLYLDKNGRFERTDHVDGASSIEVLFSCP